MNNGNPMIIAGVLAGLSEEVLEALVRKHAPDASFSRNDTRAFLAELSKMGMETSDTVPEIQAPVQDGELPPFDMKKAVVCMMNRLTQWERAHNGVVKTADFLANADPTANWPKHMGIRMAVHEFQVGRGRIIVNGEHMNRVPVPAKPKKKAADADEASAKESDLLGALKKACASAKVSGTVLRVGFMGQYTKDMEADARDAAVAELAELIRQRKVISEESDVVGEGMLLSVPSKGNREVSPDHLILQLAQMQQRHDHVLEGRFLKMLRCDKAVLEGLLVSADCTDRSLDRKRVVRYEHPETQESCIKLFSPRLVTQKAEQKPAESKPSKVTANEPADLTVGQRVLLSEIVSIADADGEVSLEAVLGHVPIDKRRLKKIGVAAQGQDGKRYRLLSELISMSVTELKQKARREFVRVTKRGLDIAQKIDPPQPDNVVEMADRLKSAG